MLDGYNSTTENLLDRLPLPIHVKNISLKPHQYGSILRWAAAIHQEGFPKGHLELPRLPKGSFNNSDVASPSDNLNERSGYKWWASVTNPLAHDEQIQFMPDPVSHDERDGYSALP